jgi:hypothetical protein
VAPAWDRSGDLQSGYLIRVVDFRTLYSILYYISTDFLFRVYLSFHVIHVGVFTNVHRVLLYLYIFICIQNTVSVFGSSLGKKIKS